MKLQNEDLVKAVELSGGSVLAASAAKAEHSRRDGAFLLVGHEGQDRAALPSILRQLPFVTAAILAVRPGLPNSYCALLQHRRRGDLHVKPGATVGMW